MVGENHFLVEKWRECELNSPPYIFPEDAFLIEDRWHDRIYDFTSFEGFTNSEKFGLEGDTRFHLGLTPIPFMGNLHQATIFLLMLNPGFHPGDYFAEYEVDNFRQAGIICVKKILTAVTRFYFLTLDLRGILDLDTGIASYIVL